MGRTRDRLISPLALLAAAALSGAIAGASLPPREYQVKAAFLYNFARFTEWPGASFSSSKEPLTICVIGEDPFQTDLDEAVKGKLAGEREILVRRLNSGAAGTCQMAFVSTSERKRYRRLLDSLAGSGVLTVGDGAGFAQAGGVVNLVLDGGTIRFEINLDAAERAHLKISSAVLGLAKIVHDSGNPK